MALDQPLSAAEWLQVARSKMGASDVEVVAYAVRPMGAGAGVMADHLLAEVTVRATGETSTLHFFCKIIPQARESQKDLADQTGIFAKEVHVFQTLFPALRSVLKEDLAWTCQCYFLREDLLVLEDLSVQGFKVIHSREPVSYEHNAAVLGAVANLHSASLIYEEAQAKPFVMYKAFEDIFQKDFFVLLPNHPGETWLKTSIDGTMRLVELVEGDKSPKRKQQLEKFLSTMYDMQKPSRRYRNVVTHGDMWRNNIMFKEEEGRVLTAHTLDFQTCRFAPPAHDVMCFLYLTGDRTFRHRHAQNLITGYYQQVASNLRKHGLDPNQVLPWEEFLESCEEYRKLALITSAFYGQAILIQEEIFKEAFKTSDELMRFIMHDRKKEIDYSFKNDPLYAAKVTDIVQELGEMCSESV